MILRYWCDTSAGLSENNGDGDGAIPFCVATSQLDEGDDDDYVAGDYDNDYNEYDDDGEDDCDDGNDCDGDDGDGDDGDDDALLLWRRPIRRRGCT